MDIEPFLDQKVSHYSILEKLGSGGMGVVYKAVDTRLQRPVALKFITQLASNHRRMHRRLEREARAASALNHPNICTLYDIGEWNGHPFIVMESLEGQSLKQLIHEGPLEILKTLQFVEQIACGLEAAHSKHIIHMDIKPANLFVTTSEQLKILDFGLARQRKSAQVATGLKVVTAGSDSITAAGVFTGTLAYASPEQLLGKTVDHRTDLFSLGIVLYEMLTGHHPFPSDSPAALADAIMHKDPEPVSRYRPAVPRRLEQVIRRLLEKQVENRYQTAGELAEELNSLQRPVAAGVSATLRQLAVPILLLVLMGVIGFVIYRYTVPAPLPLKTIYFTSFPGNEIEPVFSPDGTRIAFVWNGGSGDSYDIYVQLLGTGRPLRITSGEGSSFSPAWSPEGGQIAYLRASAGQIGLYIAPSLGGPGHKVIDLDADNVDLAGFLRGGNLSWSSDGELLVFGDRDSQERELYCLFLVSLQDGSKRRLTSPSAQYSGYRGGDRDAAFSPDGRFVAFTRGGASSALDIYVVNVNGGEPRRLTFDNKEISGLSWSADGRSILFSSNRAGDFSLWRVPFKGGPAELLSVGGPGATQPAVSPRGDLLAYSQGTVDRNIWRIDVDGTSSEKTSAARPLIASTRRDSSPQISPDGSRIVFASDRTGDFEIWVCESDGQNPVQLTFGIHAAGSPRWSPDGRKIVFDSTGSGNRDIYVVEANGGSVTPITRDVSEDVRPSWSRDGRWIYFGSNRSGDWQIWKTPASGGPAVQVTRSGGREALESPDGKYLYYAGDANSVGIWRVPAQGGPEEEILAQAQQGYWALVEEGILFVDASEDGLAIKFFSLLNGQITQLATLENRAYAGSPGFAVFPNAHSFLYNQDDQQSGDILVVENFR